MKFGFMVPRESDFGDGGDPYDRINRLCERAEELGFDIASFTHHRFSPERPFRFDEVAPGRAIAGTPEQCIRAIERCRDELGCASLRAPSGRLLVAAGISSGGCGVRSSETGRRLFPSEPSVPVPEERPRALHVRQRDIPGKRAKRARSEPKASRVEPD